MDFLIQSVANFINSVANTLPHWSFTHNVANDIATITPYLDKANVLLPMNTFYTIFSIWIGLELMLIALYWLDRVINLLRGAG